MGKYYQNQTEIEQRSFVIAVVAHITYNILLYVLYVLM